MDKRPHQFPVFLRIADDHAGPRSELLHTQSELDKEISKLKEKQEDLSKWIVTEYLDISVEGNYPKYGSVFIGDTVIPRHVYDSSFWVSKRDKNSSTEFSRKTELDYFDANPHQETIQKIAKLAGIEFGRIDYGIYKGKIQIWEFNTNPALFHYNCMHKDNPRKTIARHSFNAIAAELKKLDEPSDMSGIAWPQKVKRYYKYVSGIRNQKKIFSLPYDANTY